MACGLHGVWPKAIVRQRVQSAVGGPFESVEHGRGWVAAQSCSRKQRLYRPILLRRNQKRIVFPHRVRTSVDVRWLLSYTGRPRASIAYGLQHDPLPTWRMAYMGYMADGLQHEAVGSVIDLLMPSTALVSRIFGIGVPLLPRPSCTTCAFVCTW